MKFISTRGKAKPCTASEAISRGIAADGGLFVPETWPAIKIDPSWAAREFPAFASALLEPFFEGDKLKKSLGSICERAFNFPIPMRDLDAETAVLELFHGPTGSFKDFGARFLALAMEALQHPRAHRRMVIVATSGDTGGAVAGAFAEFTKIPVLILYPKGRISERQEKQLTVWGPQVRAFAVEGDFDDCQRMVKEALASKWWSEKFDLISANSINVARLLPQMAYFAHSSLRFQAGHGVDAGLIIPSGNVGNATAALWARHLGFPIRKVHFAHNANTAVYDFFTNGVWRPSPTVNTLANAMDVGNPSNFERVRWLFPKMEDLRNAASASTVVDEQIQAVIRGAKSDIWCPHTATALFARAQEPQGSWIVAATAHPAKFESIIEPLIGRKIPVPENLEVLLHKPSHSQSVGPKLASLQALI